MPSQDSACSLEQALKCNDGQITPLEFIQSCLRHLGPLNTRVHHREDDEPLEDQICKKLWYRKPYGPIAAALRLCERDNLAEQIDGMHHAILSTNGVAIRLTQRSRHRGPCICEVCL